MVALEIKPGFFLSGANKNGFSNTKHYSPFPEHAEMLAIEGSGVRGGYSSANGENVTTWHINA